MNLASSKMPVTLVALGAILIVASFLWKFVMPPANINPEHIRDLTAAAERGHEAVSTAGQPTEGSQITDNSQVSEEELQARQEAQAVIKRALFLRETAPKFTRYVGAALAAIGCILYPVQLLIRQSQAEAAKEEEDGATVVE